MNKNKALLILVAIFCLNFNLNATTFATETIKLKTRYPDYSSEFTGRDKCENFNRKIFIFNSKVNKYVIRPVNIVWASVMPKYGMERVQNFYTNLEFPIRLTSCLLQKDFKASGQETVRFLTNTTLGFGGLYDPAKTKFKIESRQEDMGQVLAHYKVKQGPYIVLPIIASGNLRDLAGQLLDCPLNPTSYIIGPVALAAKSVCLINKTTYVQSLIKAIDYTYADPYEITKQLQGIEKYIKNSNLDRTEVLAKKIASQNIFKINTVSEPPSEKPSKEPTKEISETNSGTTDTPSDLKADIGLDNYNPQSPVIDSMRTALFDDKNIDTSKWSELSVWNKCFCKQIKTASINVYPNRPNYKYRYILQKKSTSPLAIIYPSIGEGIMSRHSAVLAKMFYDEGYSVLIQGSAFQWEFVKSMPDNYRPGYPAQDARYLRTVTSKIVNNLESQKACKFDKRILVGTSFGALTTLFTASQEETENTLNISKFISINPPIEILFALKQVDKYSQDWKNNPEDIKMRAAVTAEKAMQIIQNPSNKSPELLPFTEDEARLVVGFIMKQKLSDLVFTIENAPKCKKSAVCDEIKNMSYNDYAQKYLLIDKYASQEQLNYDTSLYSLSSFLQANKKYKIYHSLDDYYVNHEQLAWLKKQSKDKSVFFNNGSHLGFLYRKEFQDELRKDIKLENIEQNDKVKDQTDKTVVETAKTGSG